MASRNAQRGVVTLVGALFILITLALMVMVLHRSTGSDILNTAIQSDAVEALFIAETGIEHASYVYANNGGLCPNLATAIGATNAGRGSFDVTAATPVGSDCRITVQGTVSSVGATAPDAATRTLVADLRLSAGQVWAVGNNGTILRWNGTAWTASASGTTEDLNGIHCASANACWAVGDNGEIRFWNGSSWSGQSSGTTRELLSVSCEPDDPASCVASGGTTGVLLFFFPYSIGIVQRWNGISWSDSVDTGIHLFSNDRRYLGTACATGACYATAGTGSIIRYNGAWTDDASGTLHAMNGIDCTSAGDCWAVGANSGTSWNLDQRNAGAWTPQTVNVGNQANQALNSVSCGAADDCWAAGNFDGSRYVLGHWDGANWGAVTVSNGAQREDLNGIHCVAANNCWAVGNARNGWNILRYDGTGWTYVGAGVAGPEDLQDIHIVGNGGGGASVSLVRWAETVN